MVFIFAVPTGCFSNRVPFGFRVTLALYVYGEDSTGDVSRSLSQGDRNTHCHVYIYLYGSLPKLPISSHYGLQTTIVLPLAPRSTHNLRNPKAYSPNPEPYRNPI